MQHLQELDPTRLEDFGRRLAEYPRRRISRRDLWAAFAAAFPGRPQGREERMWFLNALERLAAEGQVRLPSPRGNRWENTIGVAVPISVDLVRDRPQASRADWRKFPWHSSLHWIVELQYLSDEQLVFLQRVHEGLVRKEFEIQAPLKYRSLQLTGDEKKLQQLMKSKLFGPSRLTAEFLGCLTEVVPLAWESISDNPRMVVFENAGPFAVARAVLASMQNPPYGMVAYGGGARFEPSIRHLLTLGRPIQEIEYVGDLDWEGLRIALAAQRIAKSLSLPAIRPAQGLHAAMLAACREFGHPRGWPHLSTERRGRSDASLLRFLPEEARSMTLEVLKAGNRIPEEILGPVELTSVWLKQQSGKSTQ